MDGFEGREGVFIIGATNTEEYLDPAIKRAGRFDKIVKINPPNKKGR